VKARCSATAILYSLTENAKLVGAEPHSYLLEATRAAPDAPGTVTLPTAPGG